ncbi:MAG: hypothetical protein ACFCVC_09125, partial [Acidimicrobiia bacterium]
MSLVLSDMSMFVAGVLLVSLVTIEFGGMFLLRVSSGREPATNFQRGFFRAGHAHAGVLVVLSLATQPYVSVAGLDGVWEMLATFGVPASAILMSAGFFLSAIGRGREKPNRLIALVFLGAAVLAASVLTLGVSLLTV